MGGYEAQFSPPLFEEEKLEHKDYSDAFGHLLDEIAEHITGRKGAEAVLTRGETDQLMFRIIAGEDAQQQIDMVGPSEVLKRCVQTGLAAKKQMLEGTARLGRRIGLNSMGHQFDDAWKPTGHRPGLGGGLAKIANLGSRYADAEDRIQSALAGMPIALRRYVKSFRAAIAAENPEEALADLAGFASVVMFASRETIYSHMAHPEIREPMGARVKYDDLPRIQAARKKYRIIDLGLVTRDQVASKEEYQELQEVRDIVEASYHVPWDEILFPDAAPEETTAYEIDESRREALLYAPYAFDSEPPEPLSLEEVYPDPHWRNGFTAVETALTWFDPKRGLFYDTSHLTDHERRENSPQQLIALSLFCGFPVKGLPPDTYSFPEIAQMLGVKTQSVHRAKQSALNKLRRSRRAMALLENLSLVNGDEGTVAAAFTGDRLRTGHRVLKSANRPPATRALLVPWWARRAQELLPEVRPSERGTPMYEEVYRSLTLAIFGAAGELAVLPEEAKRSPYPKTIYDQLETYLGKHLTIAHIEDFWNNQAGALLGLRREGGTPVSADRLGQLTSKLLANRLRHGDKVTLHIPEGMDGRCGYLGAWARHGEVKIVGDPGDYTGFGMSGSALIAVEGNVGSYAGAYGSGRSTLEASGAAGREAGYRLRGKSAVFIRENARFPVATGIRNAACVQIAEFKWGDPETHYPLPEETVPSEAPEHNKPVIMLGPALFPEQPEPEPESEAEMPPDEAPSAEVTTSSLPKQPEDAPPIWAYHVQDVKLQKGSLRPNTRSYKLVAEALKEAVISGIDELTTPDEAAQSSYPEQLYNDVTRHLGAYLTSRHIEDFWNREVPHLIGNRRWNRKLQLNPNRLGQLVSKLLADRLEDEDRIKLVIPDGTEGQCGYLGAWATRGIITIVGEAGDYTGAYLSGTALVAVEGDVGDYAGAEAEGESYLVVDGQAGSFVGYKARGASVIAVQESAGESIAIAIAEQSNVVVGAMEWQPSYGAEPRAIAPGGASADIVVPIPAPVPEPAISPAPEVSVEVEVSEPAELIEESTAEPVEEPIEERVEVPAEPEEAIDTAEEVVSPSVETTPPAAEFTMTPAPAARPQSVIQTIDFLDIAYYLRVGGPEALQVYTDQIGHKGREPLTAQELATLRERFPELG